MAYIIPQNYEDNLITASGLKIRNIIEGAIMAAAVAIPIWLIPIDSTKVKIILMVLFGGAIGAFGVIGVHHYAVSEYVLLVIRFKSSNRNLKRDTIFDNKEFAEDNHDDEMTYDNKEILEEGGKTREKSRKRKQKRG